MVQREFMRLPLNEEIGLIDKHDNYKYDLIKSLTKPYEELGIKRSVIYVIRCRLTGHSFSLHEHERPFFEDWREGPQKKHLSAMMGVGGLRLYSDDVVNLLWDLRLIPRGSFQEFVKRTKTDENENTD